MSRLRRNISANVLANAWSTIFAVVLTPIYLRLLGVESYGLIGFYLSWTAILGVLDTGISATAAREIAWLTARPGEMKTVPSLVRSLEVSYWVIILILGVALFLAAVFLGPAWFHNTALSPATIRTALMLMVISLVVQVPSGLYIAGLVGLQRQVKGSALVALFGTVRGTGAVLALWTVQPDIRVFFAWQIVASVLQTAVMRATLIRAVHVEGHPARFSVPLLRSVRGFAGGMTVVTALGLVLGQMDKMVLAPLVSLQAFGLYMIASTVASGLSRVGGPFLQAFSPRFTELVSLGDTAGLVRHVRLASQLTYTILLPPAAMLVFLSNAILFAWLGDAAVADAAAPLLALLTVGTLLTACSYPALTVLYSTGRIRPVIAVNVAVVAVMVPVLLVAVTRYGAIGAASCWLVCGLALYTAYQVLGLSRLPGRILPSTLRDFAATVLVAVVVAVVVRQLSVHVPGRGTLIVLLGAGLLTGWLAAAAACPDIMKLLVNTLRWNPIASRWSA
jgi:O-antigen/teichoic acid export membrane protein